MQALRYGFEEAFASLWRGRQSGLLSTATIGVALFVLGAFLLVTANLQRTATEWSRAAELSVYLDDDATPADRGDLERLLAPGDVVASYEFVSKDEALKRFKQMFADLATPVDTVGTNPLPASYEVRLKNAPGFQSAVTALAEKLRQSPGVNDVRYDRAWLDRLMSAVNLVRIIGLALAVVLTIAAALTVANVVRLALFARRDELEIMHLVGAPDVYVRGPFVIEGVLQGGVGALGALAVLAAVFLAVNGRYLSPVAATLGISSVRFLSLEMCLMMVAGGMLVGCIGGVVAATGRT